MAPVIAGYESVATFYVTLVFIVIYTGNNKNEFVKKYDWFFDGIRYALLLLIALILRSVVSNILIAVFDVEKSSSLARTVWLTKNTKEVLS